MKKMNGVVALLVTLLVSVNCRAQNDDGIKEVRKFITENMPKTTRVCDADSLGNFALPYPFSVPCISGAFQNLFYWDTYFTNVGLILEEDVQQAKNNIDDILHLINRFGFMPNASNEGFLNRSQPPYASMMVRDVYNRTHDKHWLADACKTLEKEYQFWMSRRITPNGLNAYSNSATDEQLMNFFQYLKTRIAGLDDPSFSDKERLQRASNFLAEAESGWDFNPRFSSRCEDFNPVDLNANLYRYEKNFEFFYQQLGWKGKSDWKRKAEKRKALMTKYCVNPTDGLFYDYDYRNNQLSNVYSSAVFNVLWSGMANKKQAKAIVDHLNRLEFQYGLAACEPRDKERVYQWDFPNGWACFHYLAIAGLDQYGFQKDARRIAGKYTGALVSIFRETGNLWEKYNVEKGNLDVKNEYAMPPFMGWTAGTFVYAADYLSK